MRQRLLLAAVLLCAAPARAQIHLALIPELRLGAGYDDNLFLDFQPIGLPLQIRSDAIVDVAPQLAARLDAGGHALTLTVDYLERFTASNRDLRDLSVRLDWRTRPVGPLRVLVAGAYEHYEADAFADNAFDLGAGEAGLRLQLGERVRVSALYRIAARDYPNRLDQLDLDQSAALALEARLAAILSAEVGYRYLHVDSSNESAQLDRHGGELGLTLRPAAWLLLRASYGIATQFLPHGALLSGITSPRNELIQTAAAAVVARPTPWLELYARYDLLLATSDASTGNYRRNQVLAGLSFLYAFDRTWTRPPPLAPIFRGREITFRYRGPGTRVAVVGDWNGWDPAAAPLDPPNLAQAQPPDGERAGTYTVPPGRHEYAISVDGVAVAPPDAPAYVSDGFGGKNGVLVVP